MKTLREIQSMEGSDPILRRLAIRRIRDAVMMVSSGLFVVALTCVFYSFLSR
jgi:hypothetical protein